MAKELKKKVHREKRTAVVADTRTARGVYVQSWSQVVPKTIAHECLNAYYKA